MSVTASTELSDFMEHQKTTREFHKGDLLCAQGDPFRQVYLIKRGFVKMYDIDEGGNERWINIFGENSTLPGTWLLTILPEQHMYFYEAMSDVTVLSTDVQVLRNFVWTHPDILLSLTNNLVLSNMNLSARVQNLERSRVGEKLEFVLLNLAVRLGHESSDGITCIDMVITQEDIAKLAGVTRESLSLELNRRHEKRPYWRDSKHTYVDTAHLSRESKPLVHFETM